MRTTDDEDQPPLVSAQLFCLPARSVPRALVMVGTDRGRVRALPGIRFAKILGTSSDFTLRSADPTRWMLLTSWWRGQDARSFSEHPVSRRWRNLARESWSVVLRPVATRGRWSGVAPWDVCDATATAGSPTATAGPPVVALTRARLSGRRVAAFHRSVPDVAASMRAHPAACLGIGIGEAPVGVQGTFSVWRDVAGMRDFARDGAHREVIAATAVNGWYGEELFARFAVVASSGTIDGADPVAGR